jgi:hypothetical protein
MKEPGIGIIIVEIKRRNIQFLPQNSSLENAYAAMEAIMTTPTTTTTV